MSGAAISKIGRDGIQSRSNFANGSHIGTFDKPEFTVKNFREIVEKSVWISLLESIISSVVIVLHPL